MRADGTFPESGTDRLLERLRNMPQPITIDVPHELGRVAAREKLEKGVGQVAAAVPGGSLKSHHWEGDTLIFEIEAMGQRVGAKLEVFDTRIHAIVNLPPLAALFAEKIKTKLSQVGTNLLR
jgi:hypothetical protein